MTFGELLRVKRKEANRTLGNLADELRVTVSYLSDVERGRRAALSPDKIMAIAAFLETDADELLEAAMIGRGSFELDANNVSEKAKKTGAVLARGWRELTDEDFDKIQKVIKKRFRTNNDH